MPYTLIQLQYQYTLWYLLISLISVLRKLSVLFIEENKNSSSPYFCAPYFRRVCPATIRTQQSVLVNSSLIHANQCTTDGEIRKLVLSRATRSFRCGSYFADSAIPLCLLRHYRARWLPAITAIVSIFPRFRLSHEHRAQTRKKRERGRDGETGRRHDFGAQR